MQLTTQVGSAAFTHGYAYNSLGLLTTTKAGTGTTPPALADVTYGYSLTGLKKDVKLREHAAGLYRRSSSLYYTLRDWLEGIDNEDWHAFAAGYRYEANGNVQTAEFNRAEMASDKHYRYVFAYDGLNRMTAADYSYATLDPGGALALFGDSTAVMDSSYAASPPDSMALLDIPGDPNIWIWHGATRYDVSGITYDPNGNLKTLLRYGPSGSAVDNLTYVYGAGKGNRLSSITDAVGTTAETWDVQNGTAFTYDYNGNVLTAGVPYSISITAANIDEQNRPLSLTRSGTTTTYRYGASGQRVYKKVGSGAAEYYIVDGDVVHGVFHAGGTVKYWNILAGGEVMGRVEASGTRYYYQKDLLRSTRLAFDGGGASKHHYDYYPFGLISRATITGTEPKEKFTGKERDAETGLDYFGARYYMPAVGRWASVDPLADHSAQVDKSPYAYAWNNPVNLIDPDGRCPMCIIPIVWAVAEVGLAIYDAYDVYTTVTDPKASDLQKGASVGGALMGVLLPGGGYSAVDDVAEFGAKRALSHLTDAGISAGTKVDNVGNFGSGKLLREHFEDHVYEFGGKFRNADEYARGARNFFERDRGDIVQYSRGNGDIVKYDAANNVFGVVTKDGTIRTMFKPSDGIDYIREEIRRDLGKDVLNAFDEAIGY